MEYEAELINDANNNTDYRVEKITDDGGIEVAVFSGPDAAERARTFARRYYGSFKDRSVSP